MTDEWIKRLNEIVGKKPSGIRIPNSWRPDNWQSCYEGQSLFLTRQSPVSLRNGLMELAETVFELGADTMLKAILTEVRVFMDTYTWRKLCDSIGWDYDKY